MKLPAIKFKLIFAYVLFGSTVAFASTNDITLRVLSFDYPPYMHAKPVAGLPGLQVDILNRALAGTRYRAEFSFYPLKRAIALQSEMKKNGWPLFLGTRKNFDGLPIAKELTPIQISTANFVAFALKSEKKRLQFLRQLEDLKKLSIAVPRGSSVISVLKKMKINFLEVSTFEQLFSVLQLRRVDVAVVLELTGDYCLAQSHLHNSIIKLPSPLYQVATDVLVPTHHPEAQELIPLIANSLERMKRSGELNAIAEKYFGDGQVPKNYWILNREINAK